jgi:hypothetical protein
MRSQFALIAIHFISSESSKVFTVLIAPASIMSAWLGLVRRTQSLQVWHWMRLPMGTTPIARMTQSIRRAKRVINQFLECGCNTSPFVLGLRHQDVDHVQLWIYAEISTTTAVPLEFAD